MCYTVANRITPEPAHPWAGSLFVGAGGFNRHLR
jgi:uncharacterized membrane protein